MSTRHETDRPSSTGYTSCAPATQSGYAGWTPARPSSPSGRSRSTRSPPFRRRLSTGRWTTRRCAWSPAAAASTGCTSGTGPTWWCMRRSPPRSRLDLSWSSRFEDEHDLPAPVSGLDCPVCPDDIDEGVPADRHHQRALRGERDNLRQPVRGRNRLAADRVERDIDPLRGQRTNPVDQTVAVRHWGGAELAEVLVVGGAGRTDDRGTRQAGQLYGDRADRARSRVDQQRVAGSDPELPQCPGGGLRRGNERGRGREGQLWWLRDGLPRGDHHVLGVPVEHGRSQHRVADRDTGHAGTDLVHHTRVLLAERLEEPDRNEAGHRAAAHRDIEGLHAGRLDPHP